jgi:hypothetical protein
MLDFNDKMHMFSGGGSLKLSAVEIKDPLGMEDLPSATLQAAAPPNKVAACACWVRNNGARKGTPKGYGCDYLRIPQSQWYIGHMSASDSGTPRLWAPGVPGTLHSQTHVRQLHNVVRRMPYQS